jgi:hypothetical protein
MENGEFTPDLAADVNLSVTTESRII